MTNLFLDWDGVMGDFDGHYAAVVGTMPDRNDPSKDVDWKKVAGMDFFETMPLMPDALELFDYAKKHDPVILTGAPTTGFEKAAADKIKLAKKYLGPFVPVIVTLSKLKFRHAGPGRVLVDDWTKYKPLWEQAGGTWVTHTSAADTIAQLKGLGL